MDFTLPTLTNLYPDMVNLLKERDVDAVTWLDGSTSTNLPVNSKRWNTANQYYENFNGTSWEPLASKYMINVDMVDGCTVNDIGTTNTDLWTAAKVLSELATKLPSSSYTANDVLTKLKTVDGATSGLDADLLDGMHAGSSNTANTVVSRDASGNFSAGTITGNLTGTASTATTLTGLTSTIAELNFSDGVTSNIQTQLNGKLGSTAKAANSALLNGVADATTAAASTIVKRDASGYIYGTAFNSTLGDTTTAATHYYVETGSDGWIRPKPIANVKAELLASAALTGTPTAPTAAAGTNTTQVATTAFVFSNSEPSLHTAGSKLEAHSLAQKINGTTTYTKVKEISVGKGGVVTVSFRLAASSSGNSSYAALGIIYKNGVAVGTQRSTTSASFVTYTEDITVNAGDLVQLYIRLNLVSDAERPAKTDSFKILVSKPTTSIVIL